MADAEGLKLRKRFLRPYLWAGTEHLFLALPLTYMNRSGTVIPDLRRRASAEPADIVVVCDNMDLPPGIVRIKRRGTSRNHNGIASVMDALGSGEFTRLYVGVGRPERPEAVVEHVLSAPAAAERPLYESAIEQATEAVRMLAREPLDRVMNHVNQSR